MEEAVLMRRADVSKWIFYTISLVGVLGLSFFLGVHAGANRTAIFYFVKYLKDSVEITLAELSTLAGAHPAHFLQPARYEGEGVTVNNPANAETDLILLSGFFEDGNELRLIRRNGNLIARWPVRFSEIFPTTSHIRDRRPPATDWNIDIHGALALSDGSVVFNFEHGGLVKLDRCGAIVWTLPRQTHHSVELAEGGGFWVPGRRLVENATSPFPPFQTPLAEDTLLKISEGGKVLTEISVPRIFYDNGLEALLTTRRDPSRVWDMNIPNSAEIVHVNKIEELPSRIAGRFPGLEAGDLALSMADLNLIMVVDPETRQIRWWRIGPWMRQHDPEFQAGGAIVVFNNLTLSSQRSNIIEIDLVSNEHEIIYGSENSQQLYTDIRGKVQLTRDGGLLITESMNGRVIEVDAQGDIVWEYINRFNSGEAAQINEARLYADAYFTLEDWTCPQEAQRPETEGAEHVVEHCLVGSGCSHAAGNASGR